MSWGEIKKINDDLTTPLDALATMNHIDLVGTAWLGRNDLEKTKKLFFNNQFWSHSIATDVVCSDFWDYVLNLTTGAGALINNTFNLGIGALASYGTMASIYSAGYADDIFGNYLAGRSALFSNASCQTGLINNGAVSGYKNNKDVMSFVFNNASTIDIIRNSSLGYSQLISNAAVYTTVGSGTFTVTNETWILPVVVGGGANGSSTNTSAYGGNSGGYNHSFKQVSNGNSFSYTVGGSAVNSVFDNITGVGGGGVANGGATYGTAPSEAGKFFKASQPGNYIGSPNNMCGAGGFAGGNGGGFMVELSDCTSTSYYYQTGGLGAKTWTTGSYLAPAGTIQQGTQYPAEYGGGSAGGCFNISQRGAGGGGGYGGGGGSVSAYGTGTVGGKGGQGIVVVLRK